MALLFALSAFAQTVVHHEDFQTYKTPSNPPGWVDTSVGNPRPQANGLFKAWNDPLQGNHGPNVVYGTKQSSGKPEGNNPRIGTFSTLTTKRFDARGRFEYSGRLIRTNNDSRIGLTFLSSYPEVDKYYLLGLWSQAGAPPLTMQLFGFGAGTLQGTVNSNLSIDINKWYRFSIQVEDVDNSTKIRAKFWVDGTTEPTTWSINAVDAAATRLTTGRIGMWAAAKGDAYIDDLAAKSPVDHSAPVITFVNAATQQVLDPAQLALFQAPARIEIRVTDDLSTVTYTAKLDGITDYVSATPIAADGLHRITVNAVDGPGNTATAALDLLVDQVPPVITLQINGAPFAPGAIFNDDVTLGAVIQDISAITSVATLNGATVTLPQPIAEERVHAISVTATDQVGRQSTAASSFIVDKTAPVVTILADGVELGGGESFQTNVTLTWSAADLTFARIEATLNGAPIASGTTVSAERTHDLVVKAYDKAGHVTTETRRFILDKTAPEVRVLANGDTFHPGTTFNAPVTFTVDANDSTPTTTTVTIDGQPYTTGTAFGTEGPHTIKVVVRDAGGLATTVGPSPFTIDLTPPTITLTEAGEPFRDGLKFNRDLSPVVTAADNLTTSPLRELFLNGREFPLDTPVSEEKADHVITAKATDDGGNSTSIGPFHFILDKTKPVVTIVEETTGLPLEPDALFARPVKVKITVADLTATTTAATLNGAPFDPATSVTADGTYTVSVVATDEVGWQNEPVTATFTIDRTPPHLTFTSHADGAVVSTPTVLLAGGSDDAVTIAIAGAQAAVDLTAKTFLSEPVALVEGTNTITVTGTDKAGNVGTAELRLELDTRAPEIAILTPATGACVDATTLIVTGTVSDPRVESVKVNGVTATLANGAFTATVPVDEGPQLLTFVAADTLGHLTTITRSILVDRTAPALEVRESGAPLTGTLFNRAITLLARAVDADPGAQLTMTLDGAPYTSGTSIDAEGAHTLAVTAVDCANHSTTRTFAFTIDRTPPSITNLNPANGATVGTMPSSIAGTTDADTATVELLGTAIRATPAGTFTLGNVSFAEGTNRFVLRATDRAGNSAQIDYTVIVKTAAPVVTILEGGGPLASNSLFTRAVTPEIRVDDATATLTATLNNAPYTSGTAITADGDYRLKATATDSLGHTGTAEVDFSIDRTAPAVQITFPPSGSVATEQVEVRGVATNAVSVDVNGKAVTLDANGAFVLPSLYLESGPTRIVATARDRAGNIGIAEVEVTRDDIRPGIVLTYPPDHIVTNRPATEVLGRVLSPNPDGVVTIGTQTTPVDPLGAFHLSGYPLVEGDNTITASTKTNNGGTNSASVVVTADFTPPALAILENSQPLNDGARFATEAVLSLQASDNRGSVTTELVVDGVKAASLPHAVTATGGHIAVAVAVARDQAGNETHVERTFFIGATGGGAATCSLSDFDPATNSVVLSSSTTLLGRTTSAGVTANGVAASVADGSFRATVELPQEGANTVTLRCTDSAGAAFGDAVTLTLNRVTGDPSIEITAPAEGFVTADETLTVTGTVGPGVISADVNGAAAVITGNDASVARPFTVAGVRLAGGLNILAARGRNAAGRVATASRRVTALRSEPTIVISSPLAGAITGTPKIELAGTFADLDPASITVTNVTSGSQAAVQTTKLSDTTGTFVAAEVTLVSGEQTLRVSGRDQANRPATATVTVSLTAGAPSVAITSPASNTYFGASAGNTFTVSGTFAAAPGATVDVGGTAATLNGSAFTATAPFTAIGNTTTVVARVTEPAGASAIDTVTVTRLATAPKVLESFPAPNAVEVDSGAAMLVLFSAPMDRASLANGAFRFEDPSGATVTGTLFLDDDVLTFAPAALLARGARYTLRVTTAAKDLAGTSLDSEWTAAFTIGTSAPSTAPTLTPVSQAFCGQTVAIQGTAPAGARVQLASGTLALTAVADAQGNFTFTLPLSGQSGYAIVRVRIAGSDGSLSPAAELTFRVDCAGPQVLNATYDRGGTNRLTIDFSEPVDIPAGAVSVTLTDGRTVAVNAGIPAEDLTARSFTLHVTTAVRDTLGNPLAAPYTQTFTLGGEQPTAGDGSGFISGEIYDATTGRPLAGATITVDIGNAAEARRPPAGRSTAGSAVRPAAGGPAGEAAGAPTDSRGRYLVRLPEGAHTIRASKTGYTSVWRQIVVPAGAGVVPIDIRLTRQGDPGGETAITRPVTLTGTTATLTAIGAQALPGLLPLGWSPLTAAEVLGDFSSATLTFTVPTTSRSLTAVRYDAVRDEWNVIAAVVTITNDKVNLPITAQGAYALVYPDTAPALIGPVLTDLAYPDNTEPAPTAPLVSRSFTLDPPVVLPNGRTVATLEVEGDFPSGTAVQAYIDEELRLADGSRLLDPPFATDLLLYRNLTGTLGTADFHLAPSPRAAQVILEVGYDHIRVVPYPGRLDRGTLIGNEGGRIPGDDKVAVDIPAGATPEPLRATAISLTQQDLDAVGTIPGFQILGGFTLTLQRATQGDPEAAPVELFKPARATFSLPQSSILNPQSQLVLVELLDQTPYGKFTRLANQIERLDQRATTKTVDRSTLPLDGIVREGRYLLLAADAPIAFATGVLRIGGRLLHDARITANALGVADLTRADGIYNIPVAAAPAAPFTLIPRHTGTGDGAPYTHASSPAAGAIVHVDLALVPQPPAIAGVTVTAGQPPAQVSLGNANVNNVSLSTGVRATFTPAIDPASVTDTSITVLDAETGIAVAGRSTAEGALAVNWALTPGTTLQSGHRYTVLISPRIRAANGAELADVTAYGFTTATVVPNTEVRAERIAITIPDANGLSRVTGSAGALPANWQAVAVRRGIDFVTRYQATAAADGSFTFLAGNGGDAGDRVTIADVIDLRVVNSAGNLAAIIPLTPFVTEDRRGFIVPAGGAARFVTIDGITVDVAEGTFEEATLVTAIPETKQTFDDVPSLDHDVNFAAGVKLDFEGRANKPIELELPVPAGLDPTNRNFILTLKGNSSRGPRLFAVDTLRVVNGRFTTTADPSPNARRVAVENISTNQTLTGIDIKDHVVRVVRPGQYLAAELRASVETTGWAALSGFSAAYELFWSSLSSFFTPQWYMTERSILVIPIVKGLPFTIVGVDATTGAQAFSKAYDPIPLTDGLVSALPSPQNNDGGPYPVYSTAFRIEGIDLNIADADILTIRNFVIKLAHGKVRVSTAASDPLPPDTKIEMLNVSTGTFTAGTAGQTLMLDAELGQHIVLAVAQRDVDPNTGISVVFNEPIHIDGTTPEAIDTFLRERFRLQRSISRPAGSTLPPFFTDISDMVTYTADSGGRRINLTLPSSLQRESTYQLILNKNITDNGSGTGTPGLTLGQATSTLSGSPQPVGGGNDVYLEMRTRAPGGVIGNFDLQRGFARALALNGNVLLVANGFDLVAYDVADPASLSGVPTPIAVARGNGNDFWTVASDHHGRIYTTNLSDTTGSLRSYRLEDFLSGEPKIIASALISWHPGFSSSIGGSAFLTDRPESFPRKLTLAVQDKEQSYTGRNTFLQETGATAVQDYPNDIKKLRATFAFDPANAYLNQRVTVENLTMDMRWSADATPSSAAVIEGIIAGPHDLIRVLRNQTTYGVVSHLGHGVGVYDINAIESNRAQDKPTGYQAPTEQIVLTRAANRPECFGNTLIPETAIQDISLSSDAAVRPDEAGHLYVYGAEPHRGLLDMRFELPSAANPRPLSNTGPMCGTRSAEGMNFRPANPAKDHPRIAALKAAYRQTSGGRDPYAHFYSVASYRWSLRGVDNKNGERWSLKNKDVVRDYVLIAGGDLGLLVVEVHGNPVPQTVLPNGAPAPLNYYPLVADHLADIIWVPSGALSVRVVPRTNYCIVVSRTGRVHLVDLSHLDERFDAQGLPIAPDVLFPTAAKALAARRTYPGAVGAEDPRIVWTSEPGLSQGVLPPVVDADSGMLYTGEMTGTAMHAIAAIDPRIVMKVDIGDSGGLSEVGGIVPHGIDPPADILQKITSLPPCGPQLGRCRENASLGTFRLEVTMPGAVAEQLTASGGQFQVAVESERVAGAPAEQTPPGFPRAHLRRFRRDGSAEAANRAAPNFRLRRLVPEDAALEKALRHQRGFNKFISPWIVAVADPRASSKYFWPVNMTAADKASAGCRSCERPRSLAAAGENEGVYELFTNGRVLSVRPEIGAGGANIFANTRYAYLGEQNRLVTRFVTVMADTVRPPEVRVPGQNPAVAEGALQDTVYLHSGEYQVDAIDLNAGGRAGFDVVFDRSYRSRTIGGTILGQGWESSNLRRLRPLPSGEVELRDLHGEVWVFTPRPNDVEYEAPKGYFQRLIRTDTGWLLLDQQSRATGFDQLGRLSFETDEFANLAALGAGTNDGNAIRYLYDASGRLTQIVDPVERVSELTYWQDSEAGQTGAYPGLLKHVSDWRGRTTLYEYDGFGRLTNIKAPEAAAAAGVPPELSFLGNNRPRTEYTYQSVNLPPAPPTPSAGFNDYIEFIGNLLSVKTPDQVAVANGKPRVTVSYGNVAQPRDRITAQTWATGETVTIDNLSPIAVTTKDALGQTRQYKLTDPRLYDGRMHIDEATVVDVPTIEAGTISGPASVTRAFTNTNLFTDFSYNDEGLYTSVLYPNGLTTTNKWAYAKLPSDEGDREGSKAPGMVLESSSSTGPGLPPLKTDVKYDKTNNNAKATPIAVQRGNETRETEVPSGERLNVEMREDGYSVVTEYTKGGLPESITKKDDTGAPTEKTSIAYVDAKAKSLIARQRPQSISTDNDVTKDTYEYSTLANEGEKVVVTDEIRKSKIETHFDSWGRAIRKIVTDPAKTLQDETFGYDAAGRLAYHSRKQEGVGEVVSRYEYDAMGRQTKHSETRAVVNGREETLVSVTEHDFASLTITEHDPVIAGGNGAKTVKKIDALGRPRVTERIGTGGEVLRSITGFDRHGAPSYTSDGMLFATLIQNDALGRQIVSIDSQGIRGEITWSDWSSPLETVIRDADDDVVARTKNRYTARGRLQSTGEAVATGVARITRYTWEAGDTIRGVRVGQASDIDAADPSGSVRVAQQTTDASGRLVRSIMGAATGGQGAPTTGDTFTETTITYKGTVPEKVTTSEPRANAESTTTLVHDGLGRTIQSQLENARDSSTTEYDEAGNVLSAKAAGMKASSSSYDSRGLARESTHPGGGTVKFTWDALGNMLVYEDEAGAKTRMTADGLGRIVRTEYPDGTFAEMRFKAGTGLVSAARDRAGQWLAYVYGAEGRLLAVHSGEDASGPQLMGFEYDKAGRATGTFNANAGVTFGAHDLLGRPTITRTYRYANGSGLQPEGSRVILDVHTQTHAWSVNDGERSAWHMPVAGSTVPPDNTLTPWIHLVKETRDAGSNITEQRRGSGDVLTMADGRAPRKLASRQRLTGGAVILDTAYGYADGGASTIPLPSTDGAKTLAIRSAVSSFGGTTVAGSANGRDVAERIARMRDFGISNRVSDFTYDGRGRLEQSRLATSGPTAIRPPTVDEYTPADFRSERTTPPVLAPAQHQALGDAAATVEPASWEATEDPRVHQILNRQTFLDGMPVADPRAYQFQGGRRTKDGDWNATFDELGRLTAVFNNLSGRRIEYTWSPLNRIIGRTAYRGAAGSWILEDRAVVLREDGLPAKTTFVWDPLIDRLVAIFAEGVSTPTGVHPEAGLLRQYLHGDQGLDDPVRVVVADESGAVRSYLPVIDEAGAGSLQAVVDAATGNVVERVLYADAYGDAPRYLQGAVVDQLSVEARKSLNGDLEKITIRVHLSESIDAASLRDGMRLAVVDGDTIVTVSPIVPTLADLHTVQWELGAIEWSVLKGFGPTLEIAVTDSLRAQRWGDTPVTFAPAWAQQLYGVVSTPDAPFALRHSFSGLDTFIGTIGNNSSLTTQLYALQDLYLAASAESKTKLLTGFKSAPFLEPATQLAYFRARWYDASTGSWLTPDPRGYAAGSSNLYAGFANDPVNHIDPNGQEPITATLVAAYVGWAAVNTAVDVAIDYGFHLWLGEGEFEWGRSVTSNFTINLATAGIGNKVAKLRYLQHLGKFARKAVSEGLQMAADVATTGTIDVAFGDSPLQAYGNALVGGGLSRGGGALANKLSSVAKKRFGKSGASSPMPVVCGLCFTADTVVSTPEGPKAIGEIRVGDRVLAPSDDDSRDTEVDPATWKLVKLRMPLLDGNGDILWIETLRPAQWVEQVRAAAGYWLDFRIPEMAIEGTAEVLSIEDAPPVQPGPGRVVLSTFHHEDAVQEIRFTGSTEVLRSTAWHPLYSADRDAYVRAGRLEPGERLRTRDGDLAIESVTPTGERQRVHEIEVEYDHAYYAGDEEVLSHNTRGGISPCPPQSTAEEAALGRTHGSKENPLQNEYLYRLRRKPANPGDEEIVYYGISSGSVERLKSRYYSHRKTKKNEWVQMEIIAKDLTHDQARTLEAAFLYKRLHEALEKKTISADDSIKDQLEGANLLNDNRGRTMDRWLTIDGVKNGTIVVPWHLVQAEPLAIWKFKGSPTAVP